MIIRISQPSISLPSKYKFDSAHVRYCISISYTQRQCLACLGVITVRVT